MPIGGVLKDGGGPPEKQWVEPRFTRGTPQQVRVRCESRSGKAEGPAAIEELRGRQRKRVAAIRKLNAHYAGQPFPRRAAALWVDPLSTNQWPLSRALEKVHELGGRNPPREPREPSTGRTAPLRGR